MPDVTARRFSRRVMSLCGGDATRRTKQLTTVLGFSNWMKAGMYDEAVWLLGIAVKYNDLLHGKFGGVLYWANVSFLLINLDGDNSISLHPKKS